MCVKKRKEPVVLNQTELIPTNIGKLNNKQGSPFVVIFIIAIFVVGIFSLDYIVNWLNPETEVRPYIPTPTPSDTPSTPDNPEDTEDNKKYEITSDLAVVVGTNTFNSFNIDTSLNRITFNAVTQGTSSLLSNHNYYLELYSSSDILLQRIKLPNDSFVDIKNFSYDITKALSSGQIVKLSILEIKDEDYTNITLKNKVNDLDVLTCTLNNQKIEYQFTSENNIYSLNTIIVNHQVFETDTNYDELLDNYEVMKENINAESGITMNLNPSRGGFEAVINISLNDINDNTYQKTFKDLIYYKKGTEAKKIAFELNSSGYTCQ